MYSVLRSFYYGFWKFLICLSVNLLLLEFLKQHFFGLYYPESKMSGSNSDSVGQSGPESPARPVTIELIKKALHMGFQAGTSGALAMTIQVHISTLMCLLH